MAIEFDYISKKIKVVERRIRFPYTAILNLCAPSRNAPLSQAGQ